MTVTDLPTRTPDFYIGEGQTYPALPATLLEDGVAKDLTGATVTFSMKNEFGATVIDSASATIVVAADGTVKYTFTAANTANPGRHYGHFEVDFTSGSTAIWPSSKQHYIVIEILDLIE